MSIRSRQSAAPPAKTLVVEAGQVIPRDGTVVEGVASVDESAVTGESAPVIREPDCDRATVTAGTVVVSGRIVVACGRA
jgi:K+-transporting ATPase ATPase B chain